MTLLRRVPERFREKLLLHLVKPYTLVGRERVLNLMRLARQIDSENIPGDVVECGVCMGGTAAVLAHYATHSRLERTVWLFDSFQGLPQPTASDGEESHGWTGKLVGDARKVQKILARTGADMTRVEIVPGWFQDAFAALKIPHVALLNIDADWYDSVKLCLEKFYDAVSLGGFISIDDYGHWPGCKRAVDEFFRNRNLSVALNETDYTARWFQKS